MRHAAVIIIAFAVTIFGFTAVVSAQSIYLYLADEADASVRVEIIDPSDEIPREGIVEELAYQIRTFYSFLGVRSQTKFTPPPGTEFTVRSTAYASSPYQTDSTPCTTAAGTRVRPGVVATNFLPLGTILEINGQRYIVEDRMNARYSGYFLDVWFPSTSDALEFGKQTLNIKVIGYGEPGQPIRPEELPNQQISQGEEQGEESFWSSVKNQIARIASFLGARSPQEVNQHDIDCSQQEEQSAETSN